MITTPVDGVWLVRVGGEFDLDSTGGLAEALDPAPHHAARGVVLDLSLVDFADSTFLHVLLEARKRFAAAALPFVLVRPHRHVRRLLDLTDTARAFTVAGDVPAAIALVHARSGGR